MTVSNFPIFQGFLLGINFWKGISLFNGDGSLLFGWGGGGASFLSEGGMVDMFFWVEGYKKNHRIGGGVPSHAPIMGNLAYYYYHYYYCHYYHHHYTAL